MISRATPMRATVPSLPGAKRLRAWPSNRRPLLHEDTMTEEDPPEFEDLDDYDGGPTCPACGAEVGPEEDDCWFCGSEL